MLKKIALIGLLTLCCHANISAVTVVLDPGHGGTGARKFGANGGDGNGAVGPTDTLTEQWVNLQVAVRARISMSYNPPSPFVYMTRECDTADIGITERIQYAKNHGSDYFISIHHNGLPLNMQGTEVWWDSTSYDDSGYFRIPDARDSLFAKKTLYRLRTEWHYVNRCSTQNVNNWMQGCNCYGKDNFYIMHNMRHCPCILSEASNLNNTTEEGLFKPDDSYHLIQEAGAIYHGWHSYYAGMGFGQVSNRYIGGSGYEVGVDNDVWPSPAEFTWEALEFHDLTALSGFYLNGYNYFFHHWAHLTPWYPDPWGPSEVNYNQSWQVQVPYEFDYHIYRAYFKGGPYWCYLYDPNLGGDYNIGSSLWIAYHSPVGVDSSSYVDFYLDRHNGHSGFSEVLAQNVPYANGFHWVINGPPSDSCLMKIVARDVADNRDSAISEIPFRIIAPCTSCGDADDNHTINISDVVFLVGFVFNGTPVPGVCNYLYGMGDADGNATVNISDAVALVGYVFNGTPVPHCQGQPGLPRLQPLLLETNAD